jgi:5'-nucleotidase
MIEQYKEQIKPLVNRTIGTSNMNITAQQNENGPSSLGNLIADAQHTTMNKQILMRENLLGVTYMLFSHLIIPLSKMNLTGQQINEVLHQQWQSNATRMLNYEIEDRI